MRPKVVEEHTCEVLEKAWTQAGPPCLLLYGLTGFLNAGGILVSNVESEELRQQLPGPGKKVMGKALFSTQGRQDWRNPLKDKGRLFWASVSCSCSLEKRGSRLSSATQVLGDVDL